MSTNPFRRSSLKGPSGSGGTSETTFVAPAPITIPDTGTNTPTPLSVNTKGSTSTQKHVNFASPPAIPISPVSYPPSPESTRLSPELAFTRPFVPSPVNYSAAIRSDPFRAEAETDADDGKIEQALENAKINTSLAAPSLDTSKQDAVKITLSRFASVPKHPAVATRDVEIPQSSSSSASRQTMDVDAFTRLLLTGDSGNKPRQDDSAISSATTTLPPLVNDSSSATDTASISQRSLFDQAPANEESPRTSVEVDPKDADHVRQSLTTLQPVEGKKKPPPPTPRHGRLIKDDAASGFPNDPASPQVSHAKSVSKKPPVPPLTRTKSQNSNTAPPPPARRLSSESGTVTNSNNANSSSRMAPPPPRTRRPVATNERRVSSDLPPTAEEPDALEPALPSSRKPSDPRPPLPPARSSSRRISVGSTNAPPLPPPRRGRGSSRSSIDGQRPPASAIISGDGPVSGEVLTSEDDSRQLFSSSNAQDILADLAALQQEVDAARRSVSG